MRAALLALLLIASPSFGGLYYVTPITSAPWSDASNPATPCNLATANANAVTGDTLYLYNGSYASAGHGIAPVKIGVSYVGNAANPAGVVVSTYSPLRGTYVRGVAFTGSITFPDTANKAVMEWSTIASDLSILSPDSCAIRNCTVGRNFSLNRSGNKNTNALADTLENVTFTSVRDASLPVGLGTAGPLATDIRRVVSCVFRNVTFNYHRTSSYSFSFMRVYRTNSCLFENVSFNMVYDANSVQGDEGNAPFKLRDSTSNNRFVGCSWRVANRGTSFDVFGIGIVDGTPPLLTTTVNNSFDACSVFVEKSGGGFWVSDQSNGTRITNSIIAVRSGPAVYFGGSSASGTGNNTVFVHNTFYSHSGNAFRVGWSGTSSAPTGSQWSGNIFFGGGSGCVWRWDDDATWHKTETWGSDSSVIYHAGGNPSDARRRPDLNACTSTDSRATWGNPAFLDTAWATLTLRPGPGSAAVSAAFPGGYAGHYDPNTIVPPADTEAPARVDDLSGAAVGTTSAALTWTASGDDNRAGTATTTYVKQHTAAINTESDWTAATTIATISGGSNSTGGEQQSYAATGLSAATTYWFCVRSLDEVPNAGSVGNTISVTTSATPDTMPPSPISNLTATALTSTSVLLSWTAPGGDRSTGQASTYVIRYRAGTTLTEAQWAAATNIAVNPTPSPAGALEEWTVGGLSASTTYTFAIKASDAVPNQSVISNPATVVTQGVPAAPPGPLTYGNNRRRRR